MVDNNLIRCLDAAPGVQVLLEDGEAVFEQGDKSSDIFLVNSGYVKFTRLDAAGGATITALLDAGELFGPGLHAVAGSVAEHTVCAKGQVALRRYSRSALDQLLHEDGDLAAQVIAMLSRRQSLTERRLHAVLHLDVRARIAMVLYDLNSHYGGRCGHGHEVDVPLTQQELADLVGASRPVVSLRLNELRREGVLDYSRGYICVDNLMALSALAKNGASAV